MCMFVEFQKRHLKTLSKKIFFFQNWTHRQGLWGDEGGVRLQVMHFFFWSHTHPCKNIYLFSQISFLFLSFLSFRAMFLIDTEGVVVAREVSLSISLMITFLNHHLPPCHLRRM